MDASTRTTASAKASDATLKKSPDESVDPLRAAKLKERRTSWQWNLPLLLWSVGLLVVATAVGFASYKYHSRTTGTTFLQLAEDAKAEGDYRGQIQWLRRYSLLRPDDSQAIIDVAIAADEAADLAPVERRYPAYESARKQLSEAIARLGVDAPEDVVRDLRKRLIHRLLLYRDAWMNEAEDQVVELDAPKEDPEAMRWLALALTGQVANSTYERRDFVPNSELNYWRSLASQPPGIVLLKALDRNPGDRRLIGRLLETVDTHSDLYKPTDLSASDSGWRSGLNERVKDSVKELAANDDGVSLLMLTRYLLLKGQRDEARAVVLGKGDEVARRLSEETGSDFLETVSADIAIDRTGDYQFILQAVDALREEDRDKIEEWLDVLISVDNEDLPVEVVEAAFKKAAEHYAEVGNDKKASEIWTRGLARAPNSIVLSYSLAAELMGSPSELVSDSEARDAVDRFERCVRFEEERLSRLSESQLPVNERAERKRIIGIMDWQLQVMNALLAMRSGGPKDQREAISRLEKAVNTSADVENEDKVWVATILGGIYKSHGEWDSAAAMTKRALEWDPGNDELKLEAAKLWSQAGNRTEAIQQWRMAMASAPLPDRVDAAEALYNYQLRLPTRHRDFTTVRSSIGRLREAVEQEIIKIAGDGESEFTGPELKQRLAKLDILEASLPPEGVRVEELFASPEYADRMYELSEMWSRFPLVQAFAAEKLAAAGRQKEFEEVFGRLRKLLGDDSTPVAMTLARVEFGKGKVNQAVRRLVNQADVDAKRRTELLQRAASYSQATRGDEAAYRILLDISEEERTPDITYWLARLASEIPEDSDLFGEGGVAKDPVALAKYWEKELQEAEGDSGTFLQYLQARRLVNEFLSTDKNGRTAADPNFRKLKRLTREILLKRPHWGEAISLEGWLAALEADFRRQADKSSAALLEQAAEQLQRGIAAGDRSLESRTLLFRVLVSLGRNEEAEEALQMASSASMVNIDQYSLNRIEIINRQGEFDRSLRIAQEQVSAQPDDAVAQIVLGRVATIAAKNERNAKRRAELVATASQAIEKAFELEGNGNLLAFTALLELSFTKGDSNVIEQAVVRIRASKLSPFDKEVLVSRAMEVVGNDEEALAALDRALGFGVKPEILIAKARILRRLDRGKDQVDSLRQALDLDPENDSVRFDLARALVAEDGGNVDWGEVSNLLSDAPDSTWKQKLQHASLLLQSDRKEKKQQAIRILRQLYEERSEISEDAGRLLATVLRKELLESKDGNSESPMEDPRAVEVRSVYEKIIGSTAVGSADRYQYALFLLEQWDSENAEDVERLIDDLDSAEASASYGLVIAVKFADEVGVDSEGNPLTVAQVTSRWVNDMRRRRLLKDQSPELVAGVNLLRLGQAEASLSFLKRAYELDSQSLPHYIAALEALDRVDFAVDLAVKACKENSNLTAAKTLAMLLSIHCDQPVTREIENLTSQFLREYGDDLDLVEAIAELRMHQGRLDEAIGLYEQVLQVEPVRLLSLNNLSIALSKAKGRAADGVANIERTINLYGENPEILPELLDTKGVALLADGRSEDAARAFQMAYDQTDEPRFLFHLILTRIEQDRLEEASMLWKSLDLERLDPTGLTCDERDRLESLKESFGEQIEQEVGT